MGVDAGGAALGAGFGEVLGLIRSLFIKALKFKKTRKNLADTVDHLIPQFEELRRLNDQLDRPRREMDKLMGELQESRNLVRRYSNLPYWCVCCLPCYQDELQAKSDSINKTLNALGVGTARDVKEILLTVRSGTGKQFRGLCKAPAEPEIFVGLDEPFKESKIELLKEGSSVIVLTGLAGSGKTTLAIKLCWDQQVIDKFGENIFFVTFSQTPNLKIIVQNLFAHRGYNEPQFQTDEEAFNRLVSLLKEIGEIPILLVLDDVWPGSEALVGKLKLKLPDCTILVTSRVAYPRFGTTCCLKPLCDKDAAKLFRHLTQSNGSSSFLPDEDLVQKVVRSCRGSPLALEVIGGALSQQPCEVWQKMVKELSKGCSIIESNEDLLNHLKKILDVLEPIKKNCFMDLGLFPEDQRIPVAALIDMWVELHKLDEDGIYAMSIIHELTTWNLANLIVTRKAVSDSDEYKYYNNHFLKQHDLLRDLAIHMSSQEEKRQRDVACSLATSAGENFTSDEAEVLVLNFVATQYTFPETIEKMRKLKVMIVTNYDVCHSELNNFEVLASLSNLRRIRLEKVSVPYLCALKNLQKLSLYMCNVNQALKTIQISDAMPSLVEMNIDYCNDLLALPSGLCYITSIKKLSITNCHKFSALPQDIGNLENLEVLRLNSCTDLVEIPDSISRLSKLRFLDISSCISLGKLPEDIGELSKLRKLCMRGCKRLEDLPLSVMNFEHLQHVMRVICDEETYTLWDGFKSSLPKVEIELHNLIIDLDWLC